MDDLLKSRIEQLRGALERSEDLEAAGMIAPACARASLPVEIPAAYQDFLRVADGAVCGVVDLYESAEVLGQQAAVKPLPGGRKRWFCIGEINENSLVMDTTENTVHLIEPDEPSRPGESLGELDYFLLENVFGEGYAEFAPRDGEDLWLRLLRSSCPAREIR